MQQTFNTEGLARVKACFDRQVCLCQLFPPGISRNFHFFPIPFQHTHTDSRSRCWPTKDATFSERNIIPFSAAFNVLSRYHRRTSSLEEASYPVGKPAPCKNLGKSDISGFRLGIQFPRMSSSVFRCRGGHDRELSASILITNEPSFFPFPCFDSLFRFEKER